MAGAVELKQPCNVLIEKASILHVQIYTYIHICTYMSVRGNRARERERESEKSKNSECHVEVHLRFLILCPCYQYGTRRLGIVALRPLQYYPQSQVTQNNRPLYSKVAHNPLKVARKDRPLALENKKIHTKKGPPPTLASAPEEHQPMIPRQLVRPRQGRR